MDRHERLINAVNATATQTSRGLWTPAPGRGIGVCMVLNLTAFTTAASLTLRLEAINPLSGNPLEDASIWATSAVVIAVSATSMLVGPFWTDAIFTVLDTKIYIPLPAFWRANVLHGNANAHTYTVDAFWV